MLTIYDNNKKIIKIMKVQNIILLRRKYISYLFELADNTFIDTSELNNSVEEFKILADKDVELNNALKRLERLQENVLANLEPLENMSKFKPKDMKENSLNKQHLTKKIKQISKSIEDNYRDMNDLYQGIILHNASYMIKKLSVDPMFTKLQLAIKKTDKEFLDFCNEFKQEEIAISFDILERANSILKDYQQILKDILLYIDRKNDLQKNHLNMAAKMKVKSLKNNIISLIHNVDKKHNEFKSLYPEALKFRVNEIKPLSVFINGEEIEISDTNEEDVFHEETVVTDVKNINLDSDTLNNLTETIKKYIPYYEDPQKNHEKKLNTLNEEKNKIIKAAIPLEELTIKTATQWLEINQNGWFAITKKYISNHSLAPELMNQELKDSNDDFMQE